MTSTMPLLGAAPSVTPRKERVDVPEWKGSVVVRGLMASEAFAVVQMRMQALRRVREEAAERHPSNDGKPASMQQQAAPAEVPELAFAELRSYGLYVSHLLACAVVNEQGLAFYTADEWELAEQSWPGLRGRLVAVAERLSGLDAEDVEKNSPASPT